MIFHQTLQKYFVLEHGTIRSKFLLFFQSGARLVDHGCLNYRYAHGNSHFCFCLFLKSQFYNLGYLYFHDFMFHSLQCYSYHKMSLIFIIINFVSFGFIHKFKFENLNLIISISLVKYLFNEYDAIRV